MKPDNLYVLFNGEKDVCCMKVYVLFWKIHKRRVYSFSFWNFLDVWMQWVIFLKYRIIYFISFDECHYTGCNSVLIGQSISLLVCLKFHGYSKCWQEMGAYNMDILCIIHSSWQFAFLQLLPLHLRSPLSVYISLFFTSFIQYHISPCFLQRIFGCRESGQLFVH